MIVKHPLRVLALTLWSLFLSGQGLQPQRDSALTPSDASTSEPVVAAVSVVPAINRTAYPVFAYPGQPVTLTLAWSNIPTNGQYKLRRLLENKLLQPDIYYVWQDTTGYGATETRTLTLTLPNNIPGQSTAFPRYGARFVAAFISPTCDWCATLVMTSNPRDVTVEAQPPQGWSAGQFHAAAPDAGAYRDPDNQLYGNGGCR